MYATRDDLIDRFGATDIQNLERTATADKLPDPDVSARAVSDAVEEADSYIGVRYKLPIAETPDALKRAVCDIARYRLYKDKPTEEVRKRYEDAVSWLKRVADGKVVLKLPVDDTGLSPDADQSGSRVAVGVSHYGGVFGKATTDKMPTL